MYFDEALTCRRAVDSKISHRLQDLEKVPKHPMSLVWVFGSAPVRFTVPLLFRFHSFVVCLLVIIGSSLG